MLIICPVKKASLHIAWIDDNRELVRLRENCMKVVVISGKKDSLGWMGMIPTQSYFFLCFETGLGFCLANVGPGIGVQMQARARAIGSSKGNQIGHRDAIIDA